jgi:hypothetical protein
MADLQPNVRDQFFSQRNEGMLERLLNTDFQRRIGGDLNDKQKVRLQKTIGHYMDMIYNDGENEGKAIQDLNKEVLQAVVPDYMGYLRRQTQPRPAADSPEMDRIRTDVSNRFEVMQQERQSGRGAPPNPPNFQMALEDEEAPTAVSRFEELKRLRELEAKRVEEAAAAMPTAPAKPMPEDMVRRIQSDDVFRSASKQAQENDMALLATRQAAPRSNQILDVPPDPRLILFGDQAGGLTLSGPRAMGIANANPTYSLPEAIRTRPSLPQDIIKPQQDVVTYRENEYNLFVYSGDRDWVTNTQENRYNFSVNFDPANNRSGFGLSPAANIKFKNISRIELVKVIMATEACETLTLKTSATAYDLSKYVNVFSYPYLQVRIDELNTNGFGTNDGLNNSFGVISYDAYWASDSGLKNRGFARMIPKFLKCQKVFYPTPLATLNRMTIQIQKPDGNVFCDSADALDISGVLPGTYLANGASPGWLPTAVKPIVTSGTTYYADASGEYLWIQAKSWFSSFSVTQGDRIVMKNIAYPAIDTQASRDYISYLTQTAGHIVIDVAQVYVNPATGKLNITVGPNKVGYANFIIIRNKFNDPTTGSSDLSNWGGTSSLSSAFLTSIASTPGFSSGARLLNTSHQLQMIFRVITRDMDSATRLRPDNL